MHLSTRPTAARRALAVLVALAVALLTTVTLTGAAPAGASTPCPTVTPGPLRFTFTAQFTNGTVDMNGKAKVTGASGAACGTIVPSGGKLVATVPAANMSFGDAEAVIFGLVPVPVTMVPLTDFTGTGSFGTTGIHTTLSGSVSATTNLLGFRCSIGPITPTLTTGTSGALTGSPFVKGAGKLVANDFAIPAIASSATCPKLVAYFANLLLGLPAKPGASSMTFDATQVLTAVK